MSTGWEDTRDPAKVVAETMRQIRITSSDHASEIVMALREARMLDDCLTSWRARNPSTDPHPDAHTVHECSGQVGHGHRHTCKKWGCHSWRDIGHVS